MLTPGQAAPDFSLPDSDMQLSSMSDFKGKTIVLYFYPKDDTTGCTIEALELTELQDEFAEHNTVVLGVSKDNCISHADFRDKHGLTVRLLADTEGELCERYGVWREREKNGKKFMGILRSTFVIDSAGVIRHAMYDVKPKGHAAEVLELVKKIA